MVEKCKRCGVDTILLYFTGPSFFPSGNWLISDRVDKAVQKHDDNQISLKNILDLVQSCNFHGNLNITPDCNFSGEWCYTAKVLMSDHIYKFKLFVNGICNRDAIAWHGAYRKELLGQNEGNSY